MPNLAAVSGAELIVLFCHWHHELLSLASKRLAIEEYFGAVDITLRGLSENSWKAS